MYNLENNNNLSDNKILDYWVKNNISDCSKKANNNYSINKKKTNKNNLKNYGKKTLNKSKS